MRRTKLDRAIERHEQVARLDIAVEKTNRVKKGKRATCAVERDGDLLRAQRSIKHYTG